MRVFIDHFLSLPTSRLLPTVAMLQSVANGAAPSGNAVRAIEDTTGERLEELKALMGRVRLDVDTARSRRRPRPTRR